MYRMAADVQQLQKTIDALRQLLKSPSTSAETAEHATELIALLTQDLAKKKSAGK